MEYTNTQMFKDLWMFIRPYKKRFWLGTFFRIANDVLYLFIPWILSKIITFVATYKTGDDLNYLVKLMGATVIIALLHHIGRDIAKYLIYPIAEKAALDARLATLQHMYKLNAEWHEHENSGNKMKRIETGGEGIDKIIRTYVDLVIESTINIVFIAVVFASINWKLNIMFLIFFPTHYFLSRKLTKRASNQSKLVNIAWEEFDGFSFETLNNISTVKSLGIEKNILPYLENYGRKLYKNIRLRIKYFRTREGILNVYQELFRLMMVFFTVWQVIQGRLTIGVIALVMFYFEKIESSAREYSDSYHEFIISKIGLLRIKEILDEKPAIEMTGTETFKRDWHEMKLEDVSFAYHGKNILNHLSLTIKRGEKIGIVGISGTGKSTLFKLLLKLYMPSLGSISFDSTTLHDIKRSSYIPHIAVVPQDTELFNLSLKDNIIISRTGALNQKEEDTLFDLAIKTAHVDDFIPKLPQGVDSLIGEKGIKLSGGERQRVGLARAIFKQPEMLLLDEATSHLDSESEEKIQQALSDFFKDITAIIIAHRLSTIKKMDRIFVIKKGEIAEVGTFDELLALQGEFYKLWQRQKF